MRTRFWEPRGYPTRSSMPTPIPKREKEKRPTLDGKPYYVVRNFVPVTDAERAAVVKARRKAAETAPRVQTPKPEAPAKDYARESLKRSARAERRRRLAQQQKRAGIFNTWTGA